MSFTITMQFVMQTGLIVFIALVFLPTISAMVFDSNLFSGTTEETQQRRDAMWVWTIVIFIGAMAGNVVWYFRAIQSQQATTFEY